MTFTYTPGTDLYKVRILLGDTVDTGHIWEDAEINEFLTLYKNNILKTASFLLFGLAANQARLVAIYSHGDLRFDASQKATQLKELAKEYLLQAGKGSPLVSPSAPIIGRINTKGDILDISGDINDSDQPLIYDNESYT